MVDLDDTIRPDTVPNAPVVTIDRFNGVTLNFLPQPQGASDGASSSDVKASSPSAASSMAHLFDAETFSLFLNEHLKQCSEDNRIASWLIFPPSAAPVASIGVALSKGYTYHHANTTDVTLSKWLGDGNSRLPGDAVSFLGAGGLVLDSTGEKILLIRERKPVRGIHYWKLPGGLVDNEEAIVDAARRETREETGVVCDTEYAGIASFRQNTSYLFGKMDIYFVVALRALADKSEIKIDENEIAEAKWVDIEEYMAWKDCDWITDYNRTIVARALEMKRNGTLWVRQTGLSETRYLYQPSTQP